MVIKLPASVFNLVELSRRSLEYASCYIEPYLVIGYKFYDAGHFIQVLYPVGS